MTPFLLYIGRAGLYLGLFYAFYLLVMRRTTFFRFNRVLLLAGSYLCLLLPFIPLRTVSASALSSELTMTGVGAADISRELSASFPWKEALLALYLAGALVTLALCLLSAWKMGRLIRRGESTPMEGCTLVLLDGEISSFSWGRKVVMSRKDLRENPAIFTHEKMHVRHRHSLDLLLFLPLQILFWWNPLVWITREELRLLHEYEADEGVIQNGIDATQYQLLLVRKAVGEQRFTLASGFQHAKLKNRITMMLKPTSSGWMRYAYLAMIPTLAALMYACNPSKNTAEPKSVPAETQVQAEQVVQAAVQNVAPAVSAAEMNKDAESVRFSLVDKKPRFNGGDANEFSKWVNSQLTYPAQAKADGVQGRVTLQFTVGADGVLRDVRVLRGVREDLDSEAVRVISASPKWTPGEQDGKPVAVTYAYPVIYQLR